MLNTRNDLNTRDCGCGGRCGDCVPAGGPTGTRRADIRGRFPAEPAGPYATSGIGFNRAFERNFDVEWRTGAPVSTVWAGRWARGELVRSAQPVFALAPPATMYDPTDPTRVIGKR